MKLGNKGSGNVIGAGVALVMIIVVTVIVGSVENGTTWSQTLSGTIGDYVEPLAMLGGLALAGGLAYKASGGLFTKKFRGRKRYRRY